MEKNEKSNKDRNLLLQETPPRSKVYIHIELGCEQQQLANNLMNLRDLLEKTRFDTNVFYENTREPLTNLLSLAIKRIKDRDDEETIQFSKLTPFDGWGCTITLATYGQPHLSSDF